MVTAFFISISLYYWYIQIFGDITCWWNCIVSILVGQKKL